MTDKPDRKRSDSAIGCLAVLICFGFGIWLVFRIPAMWSALVGLAVTLLETLAAVHPIDRLTVGIVLAVILHARIVNRK